eukprot:SAG11_NODE_191_length_12943_cov_3.853706_14_plen_412_part_00
MLLAELDFSSDQLTSGVGLDSTIQDLTFGYDARSDLVLTYNQLNDGSPADGAVGINVTYLRTAHSGTTACTACNAGLFSTVEGTSCDYCPPGRYAESDGMGECADCSSGTVSSGGVKIDAHSLNFWSADSERCPTLMDLSTLTSPYMGSTSNRENVYQTSCGGNGNEAVFGILVQPGGVVEINMNHNSYDSRHETRWGGVCPGAHVVDCTDDPDTLRHVWQNDQTRAQNLYFVVDAFSDADGLFALSWNITNNNDSKPLHPSLTIDCSPTEGTGYIMYIEEDRTIDERIADGYSSADSHIGYLTSGTASADSEYSSNTLAGMAFDDDLDTYWDGCCAGYPNQELYYHFNSVARVTAYELVTAEGECPESWRVQARNDSTTWWTVETQSGQSCHDGTAELYTLDEPVELRYA